MTPGVSVRRTVIGLVVAIVGLLLMVGVVPFTNVTIGLVMILIGLGLMV